MANMSITCPGASSTMALGCGLLFDRGQPNSLAVLPTAWAGSGNHRSLSPPSLRCPLRSAPFVRTVHLTRPLSSPEESGMILQKTRCLKSESEVLGTWSMEDTYDFLAQQLLDASSNISLQDQRYIVGLAGPPGSGKTTVAAEVVRRLNELWRDKRRSSNEATDIAVAVPMDGFHLYRAQLDAMQDPTEAHARRGAPWTFDAVRLVNCLHNLRKKGPVYLPSFDHRVGDPIENDIYVDDGHRVVLVEGNYLLLNDGAWHDLGDIFDERWYVEVDLDEAMSRIEKRHVLTGKPPEIAKYQVAHNDRINAELIQQSRLNADLYILSFPVKVADAVA